MLSAFFRHGCVLTLHVFAVLQVALAMIKKGQPVKVGDIVQYVVCEKEGAKSPADRAFHPEEVAKCDDGSLKLDVEWYLAQQVSTPHYSSHPYDLVKARQR